MIVSSKHCHLIRYKYRSTASSSLTIELIFICCPLTLARPPIILLDASSSFIIHHHHALTIIHPSSLFFHVPIRHPHNPHTRAIIRKNDTHPIYSLSSILEIQYHRLFYHIIIICSTSSPILPICFYSHSQ